MSSTRSIELEKALERCRSKQFATRKRGMQTLVALGEREEVLRVALTDTEGTMHDLASELLYPEPVELLVHMLVSAKGPDAPLVARHQLPSCNYLYAEDAIVEVLEPRGKKLPYDTIEGLGLAYLRGMAPTLRKYLNTDILSIADATARFGEKRATAGVRFFTGDPMDWYLCAESEKALAAVVALHRMDHPVDLAILDRMEQQLRSTLELTSGREIRYLGMLLWSKFDITGQGLQETMRICGSVAMHADIATTLLKRGQAGEIDSLIKATGDVYYMPEGFCHWPLVDYLANRKLLDIEVLSAHPTRSCYPYVRARKTGLGPPPWWNWLPSQEASAAPP